MAPKSKVTQLPQRAARPTTPARKAASPAATTPIAPAPEAPPELTPEQKAAQEAQQAANMRLLASVGDQALQSATQLLASAAASAGDPLVMSLQPMQPVNEKGEEVGEKVSGMVIAVFGTVTSLQAQLNAIQPILELGKQARQGAPAAAPAEPKGKKAKAASKR